MSVAFLQQSFLISPLSSTHKPRKHKKKIPVHSTRNLCKHNPDDPQDSLRESENNFGKLALVAVAAGVLTLGSVNPASAAKTGGRVGGQAFRSAPRSSSPRINNSRTNIYINPPVAPPLAGGYGYGVPFYGGWGWSPFSFFAPGPGVAVGVGGGFDTLVVFLVLGAVATFLRRVLGKTRDEEEYQHMFIQI